MTYEDYPWYVQRNEEPQNICAACMGPMDESTQLARYGRTRGRRMLVVHNGSQMCGFWVHEDCVNEIGSGAATATCLCETGPVDGGVFTDEVGVLTDSDPEDDDVSDAADSDEESEADEDSDDDANADADDEPASDADSEDDDT